MTIGAWERAKIALQAAALVIGGVWGAMPTLLQALLYLMAVDFATGVLAAFITRRVSSNIGTKGIARKLAILLGIATAYILEGYLNIPIAQAVALAWCVTEGLSILENLDRAGVPIPSVLREALVQANEKKAARATNG